MAGILRGGIYWADMPEGKGHEQSGKRPVLVISNDAFNRSSKTAIVVPLTSSKPSAGFPLTFELKGVKLPRHSWVKVSQVGTISTERIEKHIAAVPAGEVLKVVDGLMYLVT